MNNHIPSVRIGMIQSAETIAFKCQGPFRAIDLQGNEVFKGKDNKEYVASIQDSVPSEIAYRVRLAIADDLEVAEELQREFKDNRQQTDLWYPGLSLDLPTGKIDNHEYWIVTEPFESLAAAQEFAHQYEPVGQAFVVKEILKRSTGIINIDGNTAEQGLVIEPVHPDHVIYLANVMVGIEFHWQHTRTQTLPGRLEINFNNLGKLAGINELDVETYLISVNSSEMTSENPLELLKAQTIAARSTILATMGKHHYDELYHLCSDDHCQCYHGIEHISDASRQAARETEGENLLYEGRVCDSRYAKICGGVMEDYGAVWDDRRIPYLVPGVDGNAEIDYPLDSEEKVTDYIDSKPDVYCNTLKYAISSKLPYNTTELFRWTVSYRRKELEEIIQEKLGDEMGELIDLIPGERGPSGRLVYMDVVGVHKTVRVGKELQIRRVLSKSHLYSACFYITRDLDDSGSIKTFHLHGAGWGHGVGLCQVGATVMAQLGFDYKEMLKHYYKNSSLVKLY